MISVGIDVSKDKSTVFAMDENGNVHLSLAEFLHTKEGMDDLCRQLNALPEQPRIVLENTGGKFCVSVFRQSQEWNCWMRSDCGLNPFITTLQRRVVRHARSKA